MFRTALLRFLLLFGIGVNVAFLLINLAPERPHMDARRRVKVLLRASPQVAKWVKENELREFGAEHDLDFEVITAPSFGEVITRLRKDQKEPGGILLASVDDEYADEAREEGLVRAIEDIVPPEQLPELVAELLPEVAARAQSANHKLWFLPKRASVDVTAYLQPAVEDAYLHWEKDRADIEAALKPVNGRGLPAGYELERSPSQWDDFDIFVVGWYWAHHPAPWAVTRANGKDLAGPMPRIARRTGYSDEAVVDLVTTFYRHGLRDRDLGQVDNPAVIDALQWEALMHRHGLIARECESDEGCDADSVAGLLRSRRIAWLPINQEDSLWVHGGARKDAAWGMQAPGEVCWTQRPAGASLELRPDGKPKRPGKTHSFFSTYFWAVPARTPDAKLSLRLARFLVQRGLQQREAEALGMLPIRQDLREQYPIYFRLDWMQRLLDASYRQIYRGSSRLPESLNDKDYDQLYTHLVEAVVRERAADAPLDYASVRAAALQAASTFKPEVSRAE